MRGASTLRHESLPDSPVEIFGTQVNWLSESHNHHSCSSRVEQPFPALQALADRR